MFDSDLKFCISYLYDKDYRGQNHAHPCYEFVYYVKGQGTSIIGENKYNFVPDTFCLIGPNEYHNEIGLSNTEVLYIGFEILNKSVVLNSGLYKESDLYQA